MFERIQKKVQNTKTETILKAQNFSFTLVHEMDESYPLGRLIATACGQNNFPIPIQCVWKRSTYLQQDKPHETMIRHNNSKKLVAVMRGHLSVLSFQKMINFCVIF